MKLVGIYCYRDNKDDSIVYIGLDNNIDKNKRHKDHLQPSNYNSQPFNRILQKNPDRYKYEVLKKFDAEEYNNKLLYVLEILYIRRYNPKFNYTIGGEGLIGFKHSEETKQKLARINTGKHHSEETKRKISESNKGKHKGFTHSEKSKKKMSEAMKGENHHNYGKHRSEKTKRKISEALKGRKLKPLSEETKRKISKALKGEKHPMYGKTHSEETKRKMSLAHKNKYATINKRGKKRDKQIYIIRMNGKRIKSSIYPYKLLDWFTKEYPNEILILKIFN